MTDDRLLTAREVAELLGFSSATVVNWAEAETGAIPCFRIGGRLRFRRTEVEAWLEERRRGAEATTPRSRNNVVPIGGGEGA